MNNNMVPGDVEGKCPHCKAELIFEKSDFQLDFVVCPTCSKQFAITKNKAVIKIIKDKIVIKLIKKYLPDFLILWGIFYLTKVVAAIMRFEFNILWGRDKENMIIGIMLIAIGVDIAVRKYISFKAKGKI